MNFEESKRRPVVLTIAGLDPSGGAGIVADIKTITAFDCFPAAAITSITYQNTTGVFGAEHQSAKVVQSQVEPIVQDLEVAAVKTGMLPTAEIVSEVARLITETNLPAPVVDPVMVSTSGHDLIGDQAFKLLKFQLLPLARVITPNIPEAERLAGFPIKTEDEVRRAAEVIKAMGISAVLIKGGHRLNTVSNEAVDVLLDERGEFVVFREEFVYVGEVHGSGCTLSAAIASGLALGKSVEESVHAAKQYITERISRLKTEERIGRGARPI
jgi:hydroxymethylpyrimidine kinase/phosphomethylpyrimidine kinase